MQEEIELPDDQAQSANKPTILLVEDNEEILNMLVDIFSPTYEVYTASNGLKDGRRHNAYSQIWY